MACYHPLSFTFQYVSINTSKGISIADTVSRTLHSNMFLLIPTGIIRSRSAFPSLHSNMFLLIRSGAQTGSGATASFTFQYVSINTKSHQS